MNSNGPKMNIQQKVLIYVVLTALALIWMYPIIVALTKSFTLEGFNNYKYVLTYEKINYFQVIFNSMIIAILTSLGVAVIVTLAGYAFSKMQFRGKNIIFILILVCLAVKYN